MMDGPRVLGSAALAQGTRDGRGGKGSIFVWGSGNGAGRGYFFIRRQISKFCIATIVVQMDTQDPCTRSHSPRLLILVSLLHIQVVLTGSQML